MALGDPNLKARLGEPRLVEIVAVFDALSARLAEQAGFDAVVVGGGAIANFSYGLPDVGILSQEEIIAAARRICETVSIPLILDIDDGGLTSAHVHRTVRLAERAGVAGVMIEDVNSVHSKHLWDEALGDRNFRSDVLRSVSDAADRVSCAAHARRHDSFVIVARTDAYNAHENGLIEARNRIAKYADAGADLLFIVGLPVSRIAEAARDLPLPLMVSSPHPLSYADKGAIRESGAVLFYGKSVPLRAFTAVRQCLAELRTGGHHKDLAYEEESITMLKALDLPRWSRFATTQGEPGRVDE